MEWTIDYLKEDKIVCVKVSGRMDWEQHKKFAAEVFPFAIKNSSTRVFIDFRKMVPKLTVLQIDDLPRLLKDMGVSPEFKIATLHYETSFHTNEQEHRFLDNVVSLNSLQIRPFSDKDEAMAWLKQADPPTSPKSKS